MKSLFKYISFFVLFLNGYGHLHADNLQENNYFVAGEISFQEQIESDFGFDYFEDSDALIHERSRSNPDRKFSETEEIEIEEADSDSDSDAGASKKYVEGSDYITALFYTVLSAYHDYNRSDNKPYFSKQNHITSYPSICVRYCVFRI
ncbi:hypothetical protein INR75_16380 [Zunongwangia sp. SCSIO 43204]|uniref:hypothetical protein n=1 Tax=Zunongwangia sp. SCSIO 43204 TaxID=2779359 RepID=UPI001CA7FD94|nr:hypothetical protein [Zunongwangia sp. SCSIO 43204]UAB83732.1 hypothetical protein INR75_16380 [Zunongwangia sp. SCSIO 43204]